MADSTHTLKLVATLDTSDVQRKLDQLNSTQVKSAAGMTSAIQPGGIASSTPQLAVMSSFARMQQTMNMMMRMQMQQISSVRSAFMMQSSMMSISMQPQRRQIDWSRVQTVVHPASSNPTIDLPRSAWSERPAPPNAPAITPQIIPPGMRPGFMALPRRQPSAPLTKEQQMNRQLMKWGATYAASHLLASGSELAEAAGSSYWSGVLANAGSIGSTAAMGAGIGMTAGPGGALVGGLVGTGMGIGDIWLKAFTQRTASKSAKVQQLAAARQNDASLLASYTDAQQLASVAGMTSTEASTFKAAQQRLADKMQQAIESGDYEAGGLAKLMDSYTKAVSLAAAASSRISQLAAERLAQQEAENAAIEREDMLQRQKVAQLAAETDAISRNAGLAATGLHAMSQQTESEHNARRAKDALGEGDFFTLKSGRFAYGKKRRSWLAAQQAALEAAKASTSIEEQESLLKQAGIAGREASFAAGQMQVFQNGMLSMLSQYMSTLKTPDLRATTSMGAFGYGMGENNANAERTISIWQEQVQIQREIRSILQDKSFEATYSE